MGSKYGNVRVHYNGRNYDSKREARRAGELDLLLKGKAVKAWEAQVRYPIEVNGVKVCTYVLDFLVHWKDGTTTYEDTKGVRTAVYRLKKKLMKAVYGIDITEL